MAAIAVPHEVCEEEGNMAPHFVVRYSALRVARPTSPASIPTATEGDVRDGPSRPGRDSEWAFFPARLCRPSIAPSPRYSPSIQMAGSARLGCVIRTPKRVYHGLCQATTTRVVRAKRTARRVIHPGLPCSHLW